MKTEPTKQTDHMQRGTDNVFYAVSYAPCSLKPKGNSGSVSCNHHFSHLFHIHHWKYHTFALQLSAPAVASNLTVLEVEGEESLGPRHIRCISRYFRGRVDVCRLGLLVLARLLLLFLGCCLGDQLLESHVIAFFFRVALCLLLVNIDLKGGGN
jgi:hypothetical protein